MQVIFTDEALTSIKELLVFMLEDQEIPPSIVRRLQLELIEGAEALADAPF